MLICEEKVSALALQVSVFPCEEASMLSFPPHEYIHWGGSSSSSPDLHSPSSSLPSFGIFLSPNVTFLFTGVVSREGTRSGWSSPGEGGGPSLLSPPALLCPHDLSEKMRGVQMVPAHLVPSLLGQRCCDRSAWCGSLTSVLGGHFTLTQTMPSP